MRYSPLRSVLLIDDNPNDRLLARRELAKEFDTLAVREVINQLELDQALATGGFDMVITDYQLGWSDGIQVLRAVKSQPTARPVIMFTNTGTQEIAVEAMKSGLSDYVIKSPRHFLRLRQSVRSTWEQFQTQLRAAQLEIRIQALLNQLEVGIFRSTPAGNLIEANAALLNMLAADSIESAQDMLSTQLIEVFSDKMRSHTAELAIQRADQDPLWIKVSATTSEINGASITDGIVEDITERKQAQQRLRQLNQTLEEKVQSRTEQLESTNRELEMFAFSISHDLRSPIRQIDGFIHLIREHLQTDTQADKLDDTTRHYLSVISELTEQSGGMIDALLDFSKTGRVKMRLTSVDMDRMVRQMSRQLSGYRAGDKPIKWQIEPLPTVMCDRLLIQQVWQNLLGNAVKFTQSRPQPVITVRSQAHEHENTFIVEDNGIGFENSQSENIFGMFQQAHSSKTSEGVGIGLANVKRIVARHGGRVWAEGIADEGAAFYFTLRDPPVLT